MSWWKSRRLQYLAGTFLILLALFAGLRMVFFGFFSEVGDTLEFDQNIVWQTLFIGLRFDIRLALLITLPLVLLAYLPRFNLATSPLLRKLGGLYLILALLVVTLIYVIDFGHYNYLGVRINATVYRFLQDAAISQQMLWESYPVVWITLGWLAGCAVVLGLLFALLPRTLLREPRNIALSSRVVGSIAITLLVVFGLLGRVSNINFENPVPLRWSQAFFSGNQAVGALGLNPVLFLYDTTGLVSEDYNIELVKQHYPLMVDYLGVQTPNQEQPHYDRFIGEQPHRLQFERTPNVVFIMLESLGASRVSAWGNPLPTTPNLDRLAQEGWMFKNFYVPVVATAKTIWASITGIPDVSKEESATRNPLISRQRLILNQLTEHEKFYFIGGSASWANMRALINRSIDGVHLYEEGAWKSPVIDVWGISDLDLFKETDAILRQQPKDKPFFAYIQTAGNHRPFTIPKQNDDFQSIDLPEDEVKAAGFRSLAQLNAVRLLDYNIGRFMEMAEEGGYLNNTIFVLFGDHNNRITSLPHMLGHDLLKLESNHVPGIIYAPGYLEPRVHDTATSLVDLMPTVAGMLGIPYQNTTLGRDVQLPAPEGEEAEFFVLVEGAFPVIGMVTKDHMLRINHDGSQASLHELYGEDPLKDVASEQPELFQKLSELALAIYESSHYQFYQNRAPEPASTP